MPNSTAANLNPGTKGGKGDMRNMDNLVAQLKDPDFTTFGIAGVAVTSSAAELNFNDGSLAGTAVASKTLVLGTNKNVDILAIADGGLKLGAGAGTAVTATAAELNLIDGSIAGTTVASKALVVGANKETDVLALPVSGLKIGAGAGTAVSASAAELNTMTGILATTDELNRSSDVSTRIVNATTSTLTVTEASHDGKTIVLDLAAGIAVTLPVASAGLRFRFVVKTTFTGAASIKSVAGADIMIGHALMGNDTDNTVVDFQSLAATTNDTIDLLGTANSTGGIAGQVITIEGLAVNLWYVEIRGDAAGTEATPFANTVA